MVSMKQDLLSEKDSIDYWNEFYRKVRIQEESTFCKLIKQKVDNNSIVVDIGCGSGRDTFAFARDGYVAIGIDRSEESIRFNTDLAAHNEHQNASIEFIKVDISNEKELKCVLSAISKNAVLDNKRLVIYLRFLLHSINEAAQAILLSTLSSILNKGDYVAAEFRTIEDQALDKVYNGHYRRFINFEELLEELQHNYQLKVIYHAKGKGLSPFQNEDPYLGRIIIEKI